MSEIENASEIREYGPSSIKTNALTPPATNNSTAGIFATRTEGNRARDGLGTVSSAKDILKNLRTEKKLLFDIRANRGSPLLIQPIARNIQRSRYDVTAHCFGAQHV